MLLPDWRGRVGYVLARCQITGLELAMECGVSRTYLSRVFNSPTTTVNQQKKIEDGLRSCVERQGYDFEKLYPPARPD